MRPWLSRRSLMKSDHGAAGPLQLTSVSTFHWARGQQRRNSAIRCHTVTLMQRTNTDPIATTFISKLSVHMSLIVCLSCKFPQKPLVMTITRYRWWQYRLYSTHIEAGSVSKNSLRSIPLSHSTHSAVRSLLLPQLYDLVMWHEHKIYQLQSVL